MHSVIYEMNVSLDGYIADPQGGIRWTVPAEGLFRFITEQTRELSAEVMGRRLYETMLYWEKPDPDPSLGYDEDDEAEVAWAEIWRALPKVVFSTTLAEVQASNARLATGSLAEEIERLRAEPGDGDIAIGGATLAAEAARLDLIDEYRPRVWSVLLGGGRPFFPQAGRRVELEPLDSRSFGPVVCIRYRVTRPS